MENKENVLGMLKVPFDLAWNQSSALLQQCATIEEALARFKLARQIVLHCSFDRAQTGIDRLIQGADITEFLPKSE